MPEFKCLIYEAQAALESTSLLPAGKCGATIFSEKGSLEHSFEQPVKGLDSRGWGLITLVITNTPFITLNGLSLQLGLDLHLSLSPASFRQTKCILCQ